MNAIGAPATRSEGSTSFSLLRRVRASDGEAWRRLVQLYGPLVYRWCRRWSLQDADTTDVFQEVFRAVSLQIGGFERRGSGSFRGWLWGITRRKLADHFRRREREPAAKGGDDARRFERIPALPDESPDEPGSEGEVVRRALGLVRAEFEERTWRAFEAVTLYDRLPADVAREMGMSPHAVYKAKSRVLCRLRQELEGLL